MEAPRIGVVAGGLGAYWPQFDGLLDQVERTNEEIRSRLGSLGAEVVDFGLVSDVPQGAEAARRIKGSDLDLLLVLVSTYMTSGQILPVLRDVAVPIVLVSLQPSPKMDHATFGTGEWLAYAGSAGLPEIGVALERLGKPVRAVAGHVDDERAWGRIGSFVAVARTTRLLRSARHGMMGHLYPGMYDIASNLTSVLATLGGHVEVLEYDDLRVRYEAVTDDEVDAVVRTVDATFQRAEGADEENVRFQARVSAALDRLVADKALDTLAYFHFGQPSDIYYRLASGFPIGATLLSSRGVPTVTEFELRAAIAMLITGALGGGGSLTEGQALDFEAGVVELGHNDAADMAITDSVPTLRSLAVFHGKGGGGVSIECGIALGPVTQFSIGELGNGRLKFIVSEGTAVDGPHIRIGNTTTRVDFGCDPGLWTERWAMSGSTHHWAMARGHLADDIELLAALLGADFERVQP
ncbi:L-fucose/L-arabinose isomerase family protein [Frondihabitans cladoniiphilus]|uniref:L-fucose/L-arabinose isomerase family protein n=1 Tax=Frondihabitans cladoniiphilus TaxID=715785 RepID=A0ABP8VIU3_9MICO